MVLDPVRSQLIGDAVRPSAFPGAACSHGDKGVSLIRYDERDPGRECGPGPIRVPRQQVMFRT